MRNFQIPGRSPVIAERFMAATSHPLATTSALTILQEGGNAVDAALAAAATLSVVEPHMTGLGGDCFAILTKPDGSILGLNASGRASRHVDPEWYRDNGFEQVPRRGAHSITVPAAVAGWQMLSDRFGSIGYDRLFADAIRLANEGYPVSDRVAFDWARLAPEIAEFGAGDHLLVGGKAPHAGYRRYEMALGRTLERVAQGGMKAFYEGEIAADIAATVQSAGGFIDEEDLAAATADWVDPISAPFAGYDMLEIPPNGQGITALIMFRLLEMTGADQLSPDSVERWHLEIEAGRQAYSVRDHLVSDPDTMTVSPADLLSDDYISKLADKIDKKRRNETVILPEHPKSGTVYLTVVDRDRMAISLIYSIYSGFGSFVVAGKSGLVLQNRGACFTLAKGHPNEIGPNKRPMHTIIPGFAMKGGRQAASFGVMGGTYQPMGQAHVFSNMAWHGMDAQAALDHPRIFWDDDGIIRPEVTISDSVCAELTAMGHKIERPAAPWGGGQVIELDRPDGFLRGGSDFRKDGCVMGW